MKYNKFILDLLARLRKNKNAEKLLELGWNNAWKKSNVYYDYGEGNRLIQDVLKFDIKYGDKDYKFKIQDWLEHEGRDYNNDATVLKVAKLINKNIKYSSDKTAFDKIEYWDNPYKILFKIMNKKEVYDDCDGYACAIFVALQLLGIPAYRRKIIVGDTTQEKHAYILYLKESDNNWYSIEGSFYPESSFRRFRAGIPHKQAGNYKNIDFTFNEQYSWAQHDMTIE